jgi:hypothetical protein
MSGWGAIPWGSGPYGSGLGAFTLDLQSAIPIRENLVRLTFSDVVYLSNLLDPPDASLPEHYQFTPDLSTIGAAGEPPRNISAVRAFYSLDEVTGLPIGGGQWIDVVLDRPMTPFPAQYLVTVVNIFNASGMAVIASASATFDALFKQLQEPTLQASTPSRDMANPQTRDAMLDPLPDPNDPLNLGTFVTDDSGDYAFDEGLTSLKKRILRRLVTTPGAFLHLPGYGVGIPDHGKKLAQSAILSRLASDAEKQIAVEPDVIRVRVRPLLDENNPGIVRFQVLVKTKGGQSQRFDVPFAAA